MLAEESRFPGNASDAAGPSGFLQIVPPETNFEINNAHTCSIEEVERVSMRIMKRAGVGFFGICF